MSIQMIVLEKQYSASTRRADAKITLLREVIERLQKGEDVDVEGLLGTGDKAMEDEWAKGTARVLLLENSLLMALQLYRTSKRTCC